MVSLPPPLTAEILVDDVWQPVSARATTAVTVARGASSEGSQAEPGRCGLVIDNRDRSKSPRNPNSPLFGKIGRNTPFRLAVHAGASYLWVPTNTDRASTPDNAALSITGDMDIRLDVAPDSWLGDGNLTELMGKWEAIGDQRSWALYVWTDGRLTFWWSEDGINVKQVLPSVAVPAGPGQRKAVRVTLDVDNGAAGSTATFYTADTLAGPWTQLGDPVVTAGVTSVFDSTAPVDVGAVRTLGFPDATGRFYGAEIRNGINGTLVASPDFTTQEPATASFTDSAGRVWTVEGDAVITNRKTRMRGEIPAWPPQRDMSGNDIYTPLAPAGILRRLGQGTKALDSSLRRRIPSYSPLAYWPMEEGESATQASSPTAGVQPLTLSPANWAAEDSLPSSSPLPQINSGTSTPCNMLGRVPASATALTSWHVQWVYFIETGPAIERTFLRILSTGTVAEWYIQSSSATGSTILGKDSDGNTVFTQGIGTGTDIFGQWVRVKFAATQNGGNVDWNITWTDVGGDSGFFSSSFAGTVGRPTGVASPPHGYAADLDGMAIGHISVWPTNSTAAYDNAIDAWAGETAGRRIQRLCAENGVPFTVLDETVLDDTHTVGPQRVDTFLKLLQDAADADRGFLLEQRERLGLTYRPRTTLYNQTPRLTLSFTDGVIADFKATDDDKLTENDVTVKRTAGSEGQAVLETGALSVQDPPDGVGRGYDVQHTLNLQTDEQTAPMAQWLLHLGTFDGMRYPQITLDLANPRVQEMIDDILEADVGDLIRLTDLPAEYGPDDVDLIVQGYNEEAGPEAWRHTFACLPGQPYRVAVVGDDVLGRADTDGSELAAAVDTDDTVLSVTVTDGLLWTTDPVECPFDIRTGGEVMTVVSCTTAAQDTFTRLVTTGWGTADSGQAWTTTGGSTSDYSVQGV